MKWHDLHDNQIIVEVFSRFERYLKRESCEYVMLMLGWKAESIYLERRKYQEVNAKYSYFNNLNNLTAIYLFY